jgi:hypothetical protein
VGYGLADIVRTIVYTPADNGQATGRMSEQVETMILPIARIYLVTHWRSKEVSDRAKGGIEVPCGILAASQLVMHDARNDQLLRPVSFLSFDCFWQWAHFCFSIAHSALA